MATSCQYRAKVHQAISAAVYELSC